MLKKTLSVLGLSVCIAMYSNAFATSKATNSIEQHTFKDAPYKVCFTPNQPCTQLIVSAINHAKKSIDVQAYSFTSAPIAKALVKAKKRKINVFVLLDKSNLEHKYSMVTLLQNNKIPFLIDYKPRIAHNKVMIIDDQIVITGSFNFTKSAQYHNAENVLMITDHALALDYLKNFDARKAQSETVDKFCQQSTVCRIEDAAGKVWDSTKSGTESGVRSIKKDWNHWTK